MTDHATRSRRTSISDSALHRLQRSTFAYFLKKANPDNGLVADSTRQGTPCSIAVVGLALTSYLIGVERGFLSRREAIGRVLATLRTFGDVSETRQAAAGYRGFYYHFLDMQTASRAWNSELSTIDTTFLLAGALACAMYFDRATPDEKEIRARGDALYRQADWKWALNGGPTVSHGWKPESGFLPYRWEGYSEALLLYILGLGSPTHPLPASSYAAWARSYRWKKIYDIEFLYAGPLFIHQLSHIWIDFRGIRDDFMRSHGIDYFENSRRAAYVQQQYAMHNPRRFKGYGEDCWGVTASDGPGPATRHIGGRTRRFYDYLARKVPYGPDDGTIAPWAAVAALPFAPEIVLPAIRHMTEKYPEMTKEYGLKCSFNPTFPNSRTNSGWVSRDYFGLHQGPVVLMVENYRSGFLWRLMRQCPYVVKGLRRAGFSNGWL
jgi:hypothetical protein